MKDATLDKKTPITTNSQAKDFGADSVVISSPVCPVIDVSGEHTQLEKSSSANLTDDTAENVRSTMWLNNADDDEFIRLEKAATKAQAAFRGYLVGFWNSIKCIIKRTCCFAFLYVVLLVANQIFEGFKLLLRKLVFS